MPPKKRLKQCDCQEDVQHLRRHINRNHVPWYMVPAYACLSCQMSGDSGDLRRHHNDHLKINGEAWIRTWWLLVNGFLLFISSCLGLGSIQALLNYVVAEELTQGHQDVSFLEEELVFIREYDRLSGLGVKDSYSVLPTRISELLHFRTLSKLIMKLSPQEREEVKLILNYRNPDNAVPTFEFLKVKISIIDCHFHLDQLVSRYHTSFEEMESRFTSEFRLIHAIANFVYPEKWKLIDRDDFGSRISYSLGIHPHLLHRGSVDRMFAKFEGQLRCHPQAIAIGEVGLDFTTTCRCNVQHDKRACREGKIQAQHKFLEMTLRLAAELDKPIIIHCRDRGDGSAAQGVLDKFISLKLTHLKVQRHCFIGDSQEFEKWSSHLPNCYFSLSRSSIVSKATCEAISGSNHHRLLLETDSPYLAFPGDDNHGPWRVGKVAQAVSQLIGMPTREVASLNNFNAKKLFGIDF